MEDQLFSCITVAVPIQEVAIFSLSLLLVIWCLLLGSKTFNKSVVLNSLYWVFSLHWEPQGQLKLVLQPCLSHGACWGPSGWSAEIPTLVAVGVSCFFVPFSLLFEKWRLTYSVKLHKASLQEDDMLS